MSTNKIELAPDIYQSQHFAVGSVKVAAFRAVRDAKGNPVIENGEYKKERYQMVVPAPQLIKPLARSAKKGKFVLQKIETSLSGGSTFGSNDEWDGSVDNVEKTYEDHVSKYGF